MEAVVVSSMEGAVRILLGKLADVLANKYALLRGVRDEVQELKDELESMNACLCDLARNDEDYNEQTRTWMKQVREVAFDAEDCIDTFWYHIGCQSGDEKGFGRRLRKIVHHLKALKVRHNLAVEIQSLKKRAQKVSERRLRYKLEAGGENHKSSSILPLSSSYIDMDRRLPALNIDESRLVGMTDKTNAVISLLEEGQTTQLKVLSIVGFGGMGKTTLAITVYNSPLVQGIQSRAFVTVSQNYELRSLLESLLKQLIQRPLGDSRTDEVDIDEVDPLTGIETWDVSQLISKCQNYLADKRYFIVLDDIWRPEAWANLKIAFPDRGKQSRILTTTRYHHIAEACCSCIHDRVYHLDPLPREESRQLFYKRVFQLDEFPSKYHDLLDTSEAILKKCNGLPLAIVSIGGMLARLENKTKAEWQKVCDRLGSGLEEANDTLGGMRKILCLGYNDLPYHLKACFLYLSVFPEDYEIKRGPLIRRWAAEGFIGGMHKSNLEEIAGNYFNEFIGRSIISPTRIDRSGIVRSCRVHDIMLEIIATKSIQENFISLMGNQKHDTSGHDKIRRLSVHAGCEDEQNFPDRNLSHVRSLTILGCMVKPITIIFSQVTLTRVLDLEGCHWLSNQDLKDICKLYLLRYLSLRSTNISELPKLVGNLKELRTLDIRGTFIRELPTTITKLRCLKHLLAGCYKYYTRTRRVKKIAEETAVMIPAGLKNMSTLQKIAHVDISSSFRAMHELGQLPQLTKLCAVNREGTAKWAPFGASLSKLSNSLRHLSVSHVSRQEHDDGLEFLMNLSAPPRFLEKLHITGRLSVVPTWISSHSNLVDLSLRRNYLEGELVKTLGKLPSLLSLKLYVDSYVGKELCFKQNLFPRLKQLMVDNLANLDDLSFQGGAPDLERLTLAFLRAPGKGVSGIENLPKLKEVEFFSSIVDSIVEAVIAAARMHPNHPRVYREDQPMEPF
ncbi:hypothetical protein EJB05_53228, partial [Eragrostis curvula]